MGKKIKKNKKRSIAHWVKYIYVMVFFIEILAGILYGSYIVDVLYFGQWMYSLSF